MREHTSTKDFYDYLIKHRSINFDKDLNKDGMNAIHLAIAWNKGEIVKILLNYEVDIKYRHEKTGYSPLHYAARSGYADIMQSLLEYAIKMLPSLEEYVNLKDERGKTALDKAVRHRHISIVTLILEHGSTINKMNRAPLDTLLNSTERESVQNIADANSEMIALNGENGEVYHFV